MGFRRFDLQEAFFVPGTYAFRVWGYGTIDPLEEVLGRDYFGLAGSVLEPGDLIYVRAREATADRPPAAESAAIHMALLMVRSGPRGCAAIRLVQDWGRSDDPDAAHASPPSLPTAAAAPTPPPKRGRGRPAGSRSQKSTRSATGQTSEADPNQAETGKELLN